MHCGIKHRSPDLGVLLFDRPAAWAGVFTTNAAAAAPVRWCRARAGGRVRALVVNSGNANACTGGAGAMAVEATAEVAAGVLGCDAVEVLVASTGPIGVPLPVERITGSLASLLAETGDDPQALAGAMLTTDTTVKLSIATAGEATVVGVAKGAAMIAPNMATMLAFLVTDARADDLQGVLADAVDHTFNRISVDACESTNDSVMLFSMEAVDSDAESFSAAVRWVCADLAEQIVRDAEGGTKLMRIEISGAQDETAAVELGKAVAASDLWRAAVAGTDPNWGRVLSALGSKDRDLDLGGVEVAIGPEVVFAAGEPVGDLERAAKAMAEDEFVLSCVVGAGPGAATVLAADLTKEYVALNSEVST
jgi:glutamate N-acetyltransferase/amino-acid N-acetyltransferase